MSDAAAASAQVRPVFEGAVKCDGAAWSTNLVGGRCKACGTTTLTIKPVCPNCWAQDSQDEVALSNRGTLYSYTIVRNAPPGFTAPYAIAYVDLPEGLRVMVRAEAALFEQLRFGEEAEIEVGPVGNDPDGATVVGPRLIAIGKPR